MPPPPFSDLDKPARDLINKDFYHGNASIFETKLRSPDGLQVTAKGTSPHEGHTAASVEAKKAIQKGTGDDDSEGGRTAFVFKGVQLQSRRFQFENAPLQVWFTADCSPVAKKTEWSESEREHRRRERKRRRRSGSVDGAPEVVSSEPASPLPSSGTPIIGVGEDPSSSRTVESVLGERSPPPDEPPHRQPLQSLDTQPEAVASSPSPTSFPAHAHPSTAPPEVFLRARGKIGAKLKLRSLGIDVTGTYTSASALTTKLELTDILAAGVKAEYAGAFHPKTGLKAQKAALFFKQGAFHTRAFSEYTPATGNVQTVVDGVVAHEGFLVGGEAGFDVQKAALTRYAATFAYSQPTYHAAISATNNLSVYHASFYQRVSPFVEAGLRTGYDSKSNTSTGIEIATKYKIDPTAFAKVKVNDRGHIAASYNAKVNAGLTFGIGVSLDAQKLNESGHKIGTSFIFEG